MLINGLRSAANAIDGGSVDLNSIPLAAVDRIEILKDSGSSIYGSDAIAGVVNVILRKSFDGVLLNTYSGMSDAGDNQTQSLRYLASGKVGRSRLLAMASHYDQDGLLVVIEQSRGRPMARALGGADQRSSATANARILVGDNLLLLRGKICWKLLLLRFSAA